MDASKGYYKRFLFIENKLKKTLNERQKYKVSMDKKKKEFAKKYGYKIFYIWEHDIKNNNFEILKEIKNAIKKI